MYHQSFDPYQAISTMNAPEMTAEKAQFLAQANDMAINWLRRNGMIGAGEFYVVPAR